MNKNNGIEWCHATLNPVVGCQRVSQGCVHCYAQSISYMQSNNEKMKDIQILVDGNLWTGEVLCYPERLEEPLHEPVPSLIFSPSMSDFFYKEIPFEFVQYAFMMFGKANWHIFMTLTKRGPRLLALDSQIEYPDNLCVGVTVEEAHKDVLKRIDCLRQTRAPVKFLSIEPLVEPLPRLDLTGIDWVIVGGESGIGARKMQEEWVLPIRDQCLEENIPFFFKQWGGRTPKANGKLLQGQVYQQFPPKLQRIRDQHDEYMGIQPNSQAVA